MTGKEICELWIRHKEPDLPQEEVEKKAKAFWDFDLTGHLFHVFDAAKQLQALGKIPQDV